MKSLSLIILFIGAIMLVAGLTKQHMEGQDQQIVYKYLTKSLYDQQFETYDFEKSMPVIFDTDKNANLD